MRQRVASFCYCCCGFHRRQTFICCFVSFVSFSFRDSLLSVHSSSQFSIVFYLFIDKILWNLKEDKPLTLAHLVGGSKQELCIDLLLSFNFEFSQSSYWFDLSLSYLRLEIQPFHSSLSQPNLSSEHFRSCPSKIYCIIGEEREVWISKLFHSSSSFCSLTSKHCTFQSLLQQLLSCGCDDDKTLSLLCSWWINFLKFNVKSSAGQFKGQDNLLSISHWFHTPSRESSLYLSPLFSVCF